MRRITVLSVLSISGALSLVAYAANEVNDRVVAAAVVLREVMDIPERGIPKDLLDKCTCVAVIPSLKKGGFIFGAAYGRGAIACRTDSGSGPWSAPSMIQMEGGSFGLQIGAQAVDLVLVIMNLRGMESLLNTKFTLGGDVSVAAGPVGRTTSAETDAFMTAEILAYSRSRGLFGGVTLKGNTLRPDNDANQVLYGRTIVPKDLLSQKPTDIPRDAQIFVDELTRLSPKKAE